MPDAPRHEQRRAFIAANGLAAAQAIPLTADGSARRYYRLQHKAGTVILMDAPAVPLETPPYRLDVGPFIRIADHLRALGLSAPQIIAADAQNGFMLVEDFGDTTFNALLTAGHDAVALYRSATDSIIALQSHPHATRVEVPDYDTAIIHTELKRFTRWFWQSVHGAAADADVVDGFLAVWDEAFCAVPSMRRTLVLLDYTVDNLVLLGDRPPPRDCGLLDFQDARLGSPVYDLMSLLEDARRDIAPPLRHAMIQRYLAAMEDTDLEAFFAAWSVFAAQRHTKVLGFFAGHSIQHNEPRYQAHITRVKRLLRMHLGNPILAPVTRWFRQHMPDLVEST